MHLSNFAGTVGKAMAEPTPVGGGLDPGKPEVEVNAVVFVAVVFTGSDVDTDPVELASWTVRC